MYTRPFPLVISALAAVASCASLAPRQRASGPVVTDEGTRFRFYAPSAHRVQLAGNWPENHWARGDGPAGETDVGLMADDDGDGMWEVLVPLGPGRYLYLFWVDEATWHLDPGNPEEVEGGPLGRSSQLVLFERDGRLEAR